MITLRFFSQNEKASKTSILTGGDSVDCDPGSPVVLEAIGNALIANESDVNVSEKLNGVEDPDDPETEVVLGEEAFDESGRSLDALF